MSSTNFLDLPREVRDMIYAYFPYIAVVHINMDPKVFEQPNISKLCRQMHRECLDVFYSRNKFFLDMRGWKSATYNQSWTPLHIFQTWINAIGDQNVARLRSLSFFSHNFTVNVKISSEKPTKIALKFRPTLGKAGVVEGVTKYGFKTAARRAERGLRMILNDIESSTKDNGLSVSDCNKICRTVDNIQPFLCIRSNLGYKGAVLPSQSHPDKWPDTMPHRDKCDDCEYHKFTIKSR